MAAGGAVAACAGSQRNATEPVAPASATGQPFDPVARVVPEAEPSLSVLTASFEQLVGASTPIAFGLVDSDNAEVADADVELYVVPVEGEPSGPYGTEYHQVEGAPTGIYMAEVALEVPGPTSFVAVTADGRAGADTVQVATADTSQFPAPGDEALAVATPTMAQPLGFAQVCTAEPACGMHETSLDEALEGGRPVVLMFATPAFCQTAVCGPSVDVLESVRTSGDWGDTAFIHCEVYTDDGQTLAEPVAEWDLPTEPWLYTIGADGIVQARADGPQLSIPERVGAVVETVVT